MARKGFEGAFVSSDHSEITLSHYFTNEVRLEGGLVSAQMQGFLTKGVYNDHTRGAALAAEQLVDHELGHSLAGSVGKYPDQEIAKAGYAAGNILRDVSKYASTSTSEFLAEAHAQALGSNPSVESKVVNDALNLAYANGHKT